MSIFLILLVSFSKLLNTSCRLINAAMGTYVGSLRGSFVNHVVGTVFAGLLLIVGFKTGHIHFEGIPVYYFFGGFIGLIVVAASNFAVPHVGAMLSVIIIISSQLFASALIDRFGLFGGEVITVDLFHVAGILLLILGSVFVFVKR